jgi:hypothetical protein
MKAGKGDALRQEQGLFCILFVAAWTKRMASGGTRPAGMASGGTRPAGSSLVFIKKVRQQINDLLRSGHKKAFEEAKVITQG